MFASTLSARRLLKLAFKVTGSKVPSHTYTEKTTERDPNRRSVVFPVDPAFADEIKHTARELFLDAGYNESIPQLYTHVMSGGYKPYVTMYMRVIAYKD